MKNYIANRVVSVFTAFVFLLTSVLPNSLHAAIDTEASNTPKIVNSIKNAIPKTAGYITDYKISSGDKLLVYIQDLHCNPEVQTNISKIISSIDDKIGIGKVILEGVPEGKVDNNVLLALPEDVKYAVVEDLLGKGLLTGVEFYSVQNEKNNIFGIERWDKYIENLYRAADILQRQDSVLEAIKPFKKQVAKTFNSKAGKIHSITTGSRDEKWYSDLQKTGKEYSKPFYQYPELAKYLELKQTSKKIDIKSVTKELDAYTNELKNSLSYKEYSELANKANDNQNEYFEFMYEKAISGDLSVFLSKYPNLYVFLSYSSRAADVSPLIVYKNEESYIKAIVEDFSRNSESSDYLMVSKMTSLLEPFLTAGMTESEFIFFINNSERYKEALREYFPYYAETITSLIDDSTYKSYYLTNIVRNFYFSNNINSYAGDNKNGINVFVSGGFHTSLVDILDKNNISYVVISPVIKSSGGNETYNKMISISAVGSSKFSGSLMSNALNPIPLMLIANTLLPAENRTAYLNLLIESIAGEVSVSKTGSFIYVAPETLKNILEKWFANISKDTKADFNISFDESGFRVTSEGTEITYPIENGTVIFNAAAFAKQEPQPVFLVSYAAAKDAILDLLEKFSDQAIYIATSRDESRYMQMRPEYVKERGKENELLERRGDNIANDTDGKKKKTLINYNMFVRQTLSTKFNVNTVYKSDQIVDEGYGKKIELKIEGKSITFIFPIDFPVEITKDDLRDIINRAKGVKSTNVLMDAYIIQIYDKSPTLFVNHHGNGVIGINSALFTEIQDEQLKKNMLKVGLVHELRHEIVGDLKRGALKKFEDASTLEDVRMLLEQALEDYPMGENELVIEHQTRVKDKVVAEMRKILYDEFEGSNLHRSKNKFLRKLKNYVIGIENIAKLVNRKDLKDSDLTHIVSTHLDSDRMMEEIERLDSEISHLEKEILRYQDTKATLNRQKKLRRWQTKEVLYNINLDIEEANKKIAKRRKKVSELREAKQALEEEMEATKSVLLSKQKTLFSSIEPVERPAITYDEYMSEVRGESNEKSGIIDKTTQDTINYKFTTEVLQELRKSLKGQGFGEQQIERIAKQFDLSFNSGLKVLYQALPEHFFRRFYTDRSMIAHHALSHSIDVLHYAVQIIAEDETSLEGLKKGDFDITSLVYGALMHDLATLIARSNHEQNSAYMINSIFSVLQGKPLFELDEKGNTVFNEYNSTMDIDADSGELASSDSKNVISIDVEKLKQISVGHKKIKANQLRDEHKKYVEAGILHDADGLSAVFDLERILEVWINEGTPIFDSELTQKDRVTLILNNTFKYGDALNDLIRQGYYRKNPDLYVSQGAQSIVERKRNSGEQDLKNFFDLEAPIIKKINKVKTSNVTTVYSDKDIEDIKVTIKETIKNLRDIANGIKTADALDNRIKDAQTENKPFLSDDQIAKLLEYARLYEMGRLNEAARLGLPYNFVISDIHGAATRFNQLLKDMLGVDENDSFTVEEMVERLKSSDIDNIYILGDMLDRGPDPLTALRYIKGIMESGKGSYVVGNHDINALMNILGVHLPFYNGFKGINEDYNVNVLEGEVTKTINVVEMLNRNLDIENEYKATRDEALKEARTEKDKEEIIESFNNIIQGYTTKEFWTARFAEYVDYANKQQADRWSGVFLEAVDMFKSLYDVDVDTKKGQDILNFPDDYNSELARPIKQDEKLREWWKAILGHNVGTTIFRGLTDVNKMSINWWMDKKKELEAIERNYPDAADTWNKMHAIIDEIIDSHQKKMQEEYDNGNWGWIVVDAIMYRNFESTEWQAYDWVFHSGWGDIKSGLLSSRNKEIMKEAEDLKKSVEKEAEDLMLIAEDFKEKGDVDRAYRTKLRAEALIKVADNAMAEAQANRVTYSNYAQDPEIVALMEFFKENFNLYEIDAYGNCLLHVILPVNENGDVSIGKIDENGKMLTHDVNGKRIEGLYYKGRHYTGRAIFDGLHNLSVDVKNFDYSRPLSEITEALTIINSIYADNTTAVKPNEVAETARRLGRAALGEEATQSAAIAAGFEIILNKLGVSMIFMGHNPVSKLKKASVDEIVFDSEGKPIVIHVDDDMSPKYGGKGSYKSYDAKGGIRRVGFFSAEDNETAKRLLVRPSEFFSGVVKRVLKIIEDRKSINLSNAVFVNISLDDNSAMMAAESLSMKNASSINVELVSNRKDISANNPKATEIKLAIDNNEVSATMFVSDNPIIKNSKLIQIVVHDKDRFSLNRTFGSTYREVLLSRFVSDHILSNDDFKAGKKTAFVRTNSSRTFHYMHETEMLEFKNVVFLTDKNEHLIQSHDFDKLKLYDDAADAIFAAYTQNINFEQMPPFATYENAFENAIESGINPLFIQTMLSAA